MSLISQKILFFVAGFWHVCWHNVIPTKVGIQHKNDNGQSLDSRLLGNDKAAFAFLLAILLGIFAPTGFANPIRVSSNENHQIGITTEIYLPPGIELPSDKPNTLSIDENEIGIILGDGTKEIVPVARTEQNRTERNGTEPG